MISIFKRSSFRKICLILLCLMTVCSFQTMILASEEETTDAKTSEEETTDAKISAEDTDPTEEPEELYVENEWNFVDGSMDTSQGIPEDAVGRLAKIRETGKLTVATEPYYAPQEFIDPSLSEQEQYVGSDIELAKMIARRMGVELEIVPMDFTIVLTAVAEGNCDLAISGLAYTPGRASAMELSKGYHYAPDAAGTGLLIREADKESIVNIKDLSEKDIVAQSGSLQEMLMAENVSSYRQFFRGGSIQDVYLALEEGTADAAFVDIETARIYVKNNPQCGLYLVDDLHFKLEEQFEGDRIAAKKGELQLIYFVNGVIDELLETGQYSEWFAEYSEYAAGLGL